jgi:His/Glu/Gln/Arg/opine family amino acid ABC transporter permease subunit
MSGTVANQVRPRPAPTGLNWNLVLGFLVRVLIAGGILVLIPYLMNMEWDNFAKIFGAGKFDYTRFILQGLMATVLVSLVSIIASLPLATVLALGRLSAIKVVRWPCVAFVEVIRALPLLLLIFYIYLRFPGLDIFARVVPGRPSDFFPIVVQIVLSPTGIALMLALTLYTAAVNAELLRSGILSLDRGQTEAARSLGLTYWQMMRRVILPQAFRRTVAPLIAQFTILVKDTSLGSIIGFIELQRTAQIIAAEEYNPVESYYVIAIIYFVINYLLGLIVKFVERRGPTVERPMEL